MRYFVLLGFLAILVFLATNYESSSASQMDSQSDAIGDHDMKHDKMMTDHMAYHGCVLLDLPPLMDFVC